MKNTSNRAIPYFFTFGVLLILLVVITIPTVWALFQSFFELKLGSPSKFAGIENYRNSFKDFLFWNAFRNNLLFVFLAMVFELLLGFWAAVLLSRHFKFQKLWVSLILAPYAISPVVGVVVWKYMLNSTYGIVNYVLSFGGVSPLNWIGDTTLAFVSVILVDVWQNTPFITIILYAAITSIPGDLFECADLDGASFLQKLFGITVPIILPAILIAVTFRTIFAFRTFDIPWILTRGGPANGTDLLSIYLYQQGFGYWLFGRASAVGWIMLVITLLLSLVYIRLIQKGRDL